MDIEEIESAFLQELETHHEVEDSLKKQSSLMKITYWFVLIAATILVLTIAFSRNS